MIRSTISAVSLALICLAMTIRVAAAEQSELVKTQYPETAVAAALEKEDCNELWRLLFPELKRRNTRAMADLVDISILYHFKPPGQAVDQFAYVRSIFLWTVFSVNPNGQSNSKIANEILQSAEVTHVIDGSTLQFCLGDRNGQTSVEGCRENAIKERTIPAFADFIQEFEPATRNDNSENCLLLRFKKPPLKKL